MNLLNEFNEGDLLLPFLAIKCEKYPTNSILRQYLFNAYMTKMWRISQLSDGNTEANIKAKEALEYEIKLVFFGLELFLDIF